jgi:hypothetical protein
VEKREVRADTYALEGWGESEVRVRMRADTYALEG